ncbi:uncharacterized protein LOC127247765 [Andrographis paniculata]|uniref:uncharacterized protein LOC127247765 n=1 Tax=Andrographis paniculata TaxID=175694 RepID=UPI0021E7E4B6|nr:uncharacterized protein LOC127247765 [Andrographis paniculata]
MGRLLVDDTFGPGKLLDEVWFFENLLDTRPRSNNNFSRSMSDPGTSSSSTLDDHHNNGKSFEETYESIIRKNIPVKDQSRLSRAEIADKLPRTPSLPASLIRDEEDEDDEEREFSMGELIRQASLNNSETHNRRVNKNCSLSRRNREDQLCPMNRIETQKSLNAIEFLKFHGAEDLDKGNPGRPLLHRSESALPNWAAEKMSREDMKAQLKFWARAVATNLRFQEC